MGNGRGSFNSLVVSTEDPLDDVGAGAVECDCIGIDPFDEVVVDPDVGVELLHGIVPGVVYGPSLGRGHPNGHFAVFVPRRGLGLTGSGITASTPLGGLGSACLPVFVDLGTGLAWALASRQVLKAS